MRWADDPKNPINGPDSYAAPLPGSNLRLASLSDAVRANPYTLRHPETDWMPHLSTADETNLIDVIIVGGGQGGLGIAEILIKECVTNILVIDKEPSGAEGIWKSHGRMPIIQSPKHYPGPDLGIPNLTYEAWHRAVFGDPYWDPLRFVPIDN